MCSTATGLRRNTIDKFYTHPDIANLCIHKLIKCIDVDKKKDLVIEPSAGNGAFIQDIKKICKNWLFLDIQPEAEEIQQMDYMEFDPEGASSEVFRKISGADPEGASSEVFRKIHVVGNPPFGRQSSMAIRFIRKSCEFCDSFSFILPKSFKKDSMRDKVPKNFHLHTEWDIPQDGFLIDGEPYNVPCVFQVWEKREYKRPKQVKETPKGFKFITRDKIDKDTSSEGIKYISFRRVGVNAGVIDIDTHKSVQSHYFIQFDVEIREDLLDRLQGIQFDTDNTVGPKSISKGELIEKFNEILE